MISGASSFHASHQIPSSFHNLHHGYHHLRAFHLLHDYLHSLLVVNLLHSHHHSLRRVIMAHIPYYVYQIFRGNNVFPFVKSFMYLKFFLNIND